MHHDEKYRAIAERIVAWFSQSPKDDTAANPAAVAFEAAARRNHTQNLDSAASPAVASASGVSRRNLYQTEMIRLKLRATRRKQFQKCSYAHPSSGDDVFT